MAVVIDSGPVSATDRAGNLSPQQWPTLVSARRMFCQVNLSYDCRELLRFVEEAHEMFGPLGYTNLADFLKRGLELDPEMVQWALQGLKRLQPDKPIPFQRAIELGRRGRPTKEEQARKPSPRSFKYGETSAYLLARLDRDHPALAARVRAGELKAKTAARHAGIIREKTPFEQIQRTWKMLTPDEQLTFLRWVRTA